MAGPGRPHIPEGIGQTPEFVDCRLEALSHPSAEFTADGNKFQITMRSQVPLKLATEIVEYKNSMPMEKLRGGVLCQQADNQLTLLVCVPEPAWYKLNIFAKPASKEGATLPGIYTYLFFVKAITVPFCPFPKQLADFGEGCFLFEPHTINSSNDMSKVDFKVRVAPPAKRVAVKARDEWTQLRSMDGSVWEGQVNLNHYKGQGVDVSINACLGPDDTRFSTLLVYQV